jgi:hypothetical protein
MKKFEDLILTKYKTIIIILIVVFLITLVGFVYILNNKEKIKEYFTGNSDDTHLTVTPTPSVTTVLDPGKGEKELNIGNRIPGTTETIEIIAHKKTEQDNVALIRLRIEGGEIIEVNSKYIIVGACSNFNKILIDKICADVAKTDAFVEGEIIATIKIRWLEGQVQHIFRSAEDGMYNGVDFNASN